MSVTFENLETRRMMSAAVKSAVLRVYGTPADDHVVLHVERGRIVVTSNGVREGAFARSAFRTIAIDTGAGDDYLSISPNIATRVRAFGGAGDDVLGGGSGPDTIDGGAGDDILSGRAGNDRLLPGTGSNLLNGAAGADVIDYATADRGVEVNLRGQATWYNVKPGHYEDGEPVDTFAGIENAEASPFNDVIRGTRLSTYLNGRGGDDMLRAYTKTATSLFGGDGDDTLDGADKATNLIDGGAGADTADYEYWHQAGVMVTLDNLANDGEAGEKDHVKDCENVTGGYGPDTLIGNDGPNRMDGANGDDVVTGLDGNDTLSGGNGQDRIDGGLGGDVLDGGRDNDTLTGGAGLDSFDGGAGDDVFYANDSVKELIFGGAGADRALVDIASAYNNYTSDTISEVEKTDGYSLPT
jgi:Ca2+-binding RTX toxin-like protein